MLLATQDSPVQRRWGQTRAWTQDMRLTADRLGEKLPPSLWGYEQRASGEQALNVNVGFELGFESQLEFIG